MVVVVVARVAVVIVHIATRNASAVIVGDALLVIEVEIVAPAVGGARPIGTSHCQGCQHASGRGRRYKCSILEMVGARVGLKERKQQATIRRSSSDGHRSHGCNY